MSVNIRLCPWCREAIPEDKYVQHVKEKHPGLDLATVLMDLPNKASSQPPPTQRPINRSWYANPTTPPNDREQQGLRLWVKDTFIKMLKDEPQAQKEYRELSLALRRLGYDAMAEAVERIAAQEGEHKLILQDLQQSLQTLSQL